MKIKKNLLLGALAALSLGSASASVVYFTGATSFQQSGDNALLQYATNHYGTDVTYDNATFGKETNIIYTWGTSAGNATNLIIVHWAGSENIIQALAQPAGLTTNAIKFNFYPTNASNGLVTTGITNSEYPQVGLYDNAQATSFFNGYGAGDGINYGTVVNETPFAAEGYVIIANTNWPVAGTTNATVTGGVSTNVVTYGNVTDQEFRQLFVVGTAPLSYITGNTNDLTNSVWATGRNLDGGTRTVWFNETAFGVQNATVQYELVQTNGSNVITPWPSATIDGVVEGYGDGGYSSDGSLRGIFTNALATGPGIDQSGSYPGLSGNNYLIGYSSIHNATGSAGVKFLTYNGVVPSSANIEIGTYSGWAKVNIGQSAIASTTNSAAIATSILTIFSGWTDSQFGAGNAALGNLQVSRDSDGGNIAPNNP